MDACSLTLTPSKVGFVLTSPVVRIGYSTEEHYFYRSLFEIYDFDDDGRMDFQDCLYIFKRSGARDDAIKEILHQVYGNVDKNNVTLGHMTQEQFLICCKLISNFQVRNNVDIQSLMNENCEFPLAYFGFDEKDLSIELFDTSSTKLDQFEIEVIGWKTIGEGFTSHILYQIRYVTNLPTYSKKENILYHRYSDFLFLSSQLERYRGTLVPELPPKQWSVQADEMTADLRVRDLSIFLFYISKHPRLRNTLELKVKMELITS